ncbi:MAG: hypothetical protein ABL966_04530 [Acidimicrobiales bacterium]
MMPEEPDIDLAAVMGPSVLSLLARWPGKLLEEVLLAPWTLARVRSSLTALPGKIDGLSQSLTETTAVLDEMLPDLDDRLAGVAHDLTRFREAVGSIPGVGRALRS